MCAREWRLVCILGTLKSWQSTPKMPGGCESIMVFGIKGLRPPLSSSILSSFAYHTAILLTVHEWVGQSGVLDRFCIGWRQKVALYFLPSHIEL
jgi:hypothetical protein